MAVSRDAAAGHGARACRVGGGQVGSEGKTQVGQVGQVGSEGKTLDGDGWVGAALLPTSLWHAPTQQCTERADGATGRRIHAV